MSTVPAPPEVDETTPVAARQRRRGGRRGLLGKYVLSLVALVGGILLAAGGVEIYYSASENEAALIELQREKAKGAASRIEQYIQGIVDDVRWSAAPMGGASGASVDDQRLAYLKLLREVPAVTDIAHLDPQGREQLRVSRLAMDVVGSGTDRSGEPTFTEAKAGGVWFGPVYFRKETEPYMSIATSRGRARSPVVVAEVNLKFIWDVVSDIRLGVGGLAYAVDGTGHLIAHPDISRVLQRTDLSGLPQVAAALERLRGGTESGQEINVAEDSDGREVLSAFSLIAPLRWAVFVEQPRAEAYAPVRDSVVRTGILLLVGLVLSVVVSVLLARRMVRPIRTLQEGAARIAEGRLEHRLDVSTGDELEQLAGEFNAMASELQESYATLEGRVEERTRELSESLERQTATSEILRAISRSPTDYQPVFDAILANATRLCDAPRGMLYLCTEDGLQAVANRGGSPEFVEFFQANPIPLDSAGSVNARAVREGIPVQELDVAASQGYRDGQPHRVYSVDTEGVRTLLAVPMLKEGEAIGAIGLHRREVKEFDEKHIELVTTFADQAVIAIENVRLFQALEARTAELTETLERQTATSEILRAISRSPTDYQPVFESILDNATRLCDAPLGLLLMREDDGLHVVAHRGARPEYVESLKSAPPVPLDPERAVSARAVLEGVPIQILDPLDDEIYRGGQHHRVTAVQLEGIRSHIIVPMVKGDEGLGVILIYRREVRAFEDKHIEIVSTFADQAVIAIENVRVFQALEARTAELTESLERQTATSEILRAISRSPTDYQSVFDAILANATRLCDAPLGTLFMIEDEGLRAVANIGGRREWVEFLESEHLTPDPEQGFTARVAAERVPMQMSDIADDEIYRDGQRARVAAVDLEGIRTVLAVPIVRNDQSVGVIAVYRREVREFSDKHIELIATFADQAVIAIENVRMFQAVEARTAELTETLERQTATSEILRAISRSPTDYEPVFEAILANATRLCGAPLGMLFLREGGELRAVSYKGARREFVEFMKDHPLRLEREFGMTSQAALDGVAMQIPDLADDEIYRGGQPNRVAAVELEGIRTFLAVPMVKGGESIGVISLYRREVREFEEKHVELVSTFAAQAVIAIENVRVFQELQSRTRELTRTVGELGALGEVAQAVSSTLDVQTVLTTIVNQAVALSGADAGAVHEFDEATGTLPPRAAPGFQEELLELGAPRLGEGAVGRAAESRAPVQIPDVNEPGAYVGPLKDALSRWGIRALLAVPMVREDRVLGTLLVARNSPGEFPEETVELLRSLGTQSAIAIQNARLYRELEEQSRELEAANRHKSEFLANMSHELRTPLNAVIGFSEVLGERMFGELNDKQAEYVGDIHHSGRHLLSLINDILDLSKIEAGAMELDLGRFELYSALDNALTLVKERAARRGISLRSELAEHLGEMVGDERKLKQILLNLLSNAVKFTSEGGTVTLEARRHNSTVEIAVRDTGVGISTEDQAVIFEEFRQVGTDYARKIEGTGLGLTLTKRFVEMHGGEIAVESEPGAGSVFRVSLPLKPPEGRA